jgi:hypothetical protein
MGEIQRDAIDKACEEIRCADCALMKACYGNVPYEKRIGCPMYEPRTAPDGPRTRNGAH